MFIYRSQLRDVNGIQRTAGFLSLPHVPQDISFINGSKIGEGGGYEASWKFSKRTALALTSSLFDPLGLLSPLSIRGRIFMQSLWKAKVNWDESLSEEYVKALTLKSRKSLSKDPI